MSPEFPVKVIEALSKRVAHRCSNPDCSKVTVGPNTEPSKVTSIGEAAHIFGAKPGSARYRAVMSDAERSMISNGIWLCRDCHGLIDRDALGFPAELLFQWKTHQEERALRELGKPGELLRYQIEKSEIDELGEIPEFVRQVIKDKPSHWEYTATAELLEFFMRNPVRRASQLKNGLYSNQGEIVTLGRFGQWSEAKLAEMVEEVQCLKNLLPAIMASWGAPGVSGDPVAIMHACRLYGQCAQRLVALAEDLKFAHLPQGFRELGPHLAKGAIHPIERMLEVAAFIRSVIGGDTRRGVLEFNLIIELPDGWSEELDQIAASAFEALSDLPRQ